MDKTEAILIDRTPYRETSLIVQWCAAEAGVFRTIAKGALRPKSPFAGRLDLFVSAEVRVVRARSSDLHTLAEARWTNGRPGLRRSYARVLAATYLSKLVTQVVERETAIPGVYELLRKALDFLDEKEPVPALIGRFEQRLGEELGVAGDGDVLRALEEVSHRALPVQRGQLLNLIAGGGTKFSAKKNGDEGPEDSACGPRASGMM